MCVRIHSNVDSVADQVKTRKNKSENEKTICVRACVCSMSQWWRIPAAIELLVIYRRLLADGPLDENSNNKL